MSAKFERVMLRGVDTEFVVWHPVRTVRVEVQRAGGGVRGGWRAGARQVRCCWAVCWSARCCTLHSRRHAAVRVVFPQCMCVVLS